MSSGTVELTKIEEVLQQAEPDTEHGFLMTSALVAAGYGIETSTIRTHKQTLLGDEGKGVEAQIEEGVHFFKNKQNHTIWTRRGVIQLGFCVQSNRATQFKKMAEQWVVEGMDAQQAIETADAATVPVPAQSFNAVPADFDSMCQAIAQQVGPVVAERMLTSGVEKYLPGEISKAMEPAGKALGAILSTRYGVDLSQVVSQVVASYQSQTEVSAQ